MQRDDRRANQKRSNAGAMVPVVVPVEGKKITLQNGKLNVSENPIILLY